MWTFTKVPCQTSCLWKKILWGFITGLRLRVQILYFITWMYIFACCIDFFAIFSFLFHVYDPRNPVFGVVALCTYFICQVGEHQYFMTCSFLELDCLPECGAWLFRDMFWSIFDGCDFRYSEDSLRWKCCERMVRGAEQSFFQNVWTPFSVLFKFLLLFFFLTLLAAIKMTNFFPS